VSRRSLLIGSAAIGALGVIGLAIGFVVEPTQAAFSYLTAWAFALSIALGALIFLMIGHAANAQWVIVFRRFTESVVATLPILAVLFVPIALSLDLLYPWVDPPTTLGHEALEKLAHKAQYLNVGFFAVRAIVFLAVWIVLGELLTRWGTRQDRGESRYTSRLRALSAGGLPLVALTLTFAAFDWLMSLTPLWYSTIYGLLYFSGGFVAALSLLAVVARCARRIAVVRSSIHASHTGALGRLMFAFLVFWAYMEFSQGIIIWIANKPDEVPWYVARGAGVWGGVFAVLVIGHFALPFFALLSRPLKRRPTLLAIAGAWIVLMHYIDVYWLVMPVLHQSLSIDWLDVAAPCAILGSATAFAIARTGTRSAIADADPRFAAAIAYEGS
jgi:hypothetical protein